MQIHHFSFQDIPQFSSRDIAYTTADDRLRPFYKYEVSLDTFDQVFKDKSEANINRELLVEVLKEQYKPFEANELVYSQIDKLKEEKTFTVVTAHQPSLFTWPLYFIYNIFSAFNLAEQFIITYEDHHVVPIFVIVGEDHDFEEINHAHLFNKELVWENEEGGAVGQMKTESLQSVLQDLKEILGHSENATTLYEKIERSFTQFET